MKEGEKHEGDVLEQLGHRGERPLSLLDQIEGGTFDLELASWLISRVSRGDSFFIGAIPGSAGKTTTVRALLGFAPGDVPYVIALPNKLAGIDGQRCCFVSHELSDHKVPNYLWGRDLRDYFALSAHGHMLAANMHADELDQVHEQIGGRNDVPEEHFRAVNIFAFIRVDKEADPIERVVDKVFYSDGTGPHKSIFTLEGGMSANRPRDEENEKRCRAFLEESLSGSARTVDEVRRLFLEWEKTA